MTEDKQLKREIETEIVEAIENEMPVSHIVNYLLDCRGYRAWLLHNIGNEFDIKHYIEKVAERADEVA